MALLIFISVKQGDVDETVCSLNPDYSSFPEAMIDFQLSNGQMDEYPASYAVPTETAFAAIKALYLTGEKPAGIHWHED